MKNVTVTFTGEQAKILLQMIRNDSMQWEQLGSEGRNFLQQNNRIENRLLKAMMEVHPGKPLK